MSEKWIYATYSYLDQTEYTLTFSALKGEFQSANFGKYFGEEELAFLVVQTVAFKVTKTSAMFCWPWLINCYHYLALC